MTKTEYVAEMLTEAMHIEGVDLLPTVIYAIAGDIVQGLDMWYEMSGDSVASSNRYGELESQIEKLKRDKEKILDQANNGHHKEMEELKRYNRNVIYQKNQQIEELKKQIP